MIGFAEYSGFADYSAFTTRAQRIRSAKYMLALFKLAPKSLRKRYAMMCIRQQRWF